METIENLRVNWMDSKNSRGVEKRNMKNMQNIKFCLVYLKRNINRACMYIRERYSSYSSYSAS